MDMFRTKHVGFSRVRIGGSKSERPMPAIHVSSLTGYISTISFLKRAYSLKEATTTKSIHTNVNSVVISPNNHQIFQLPK
jgi:hypothetical protein